VAESEAEEASRQKIQFTDTLWGIVKHGPTVVEAVHVGDPTVEDPQRTLAPEITKENMDMYKAALSAGNTAAPATAPAPTAANEPPRSDQPSAAPVEVETPGGTGVGVSIVSAPNSSAAANPNALVNPVSPNNAAAVPPAQAPAPAPDQINEIRPGTSQQANADDTAKKAPKADLNDESSSKKKKKKGLAKLNPF
ncbi:MAG: hypothetical protein WBX09_13440, partial [Terracidiphilus sp.]